jgi:uncharacterized cupin superfamily protein
MDRTPVQEAKLVDTPAGRKPEGNGWFVINLDEATAIASPDAGHAFIFEPERRAFPHFGINIQVLQPGEPSAKYHAEEAQEGFVVLHGEVRLIVEEQERIMRQWDFFHCPPWTAHVTIGAGDGPSAILMVGARNVGEGLIYPRSERAAEFNASAAQTTENADEAYADWTMPEPARKPWPPSGGGH